MIQHQETMFLIVSVEVRYWEDTEVNGETDTEIGDNIPCKFGNFWQPVIDFRTGQILNWRIGIAAGVHYKVCDKCQWWLIDSDSDNNGCAKISKQSNKDYVPRILCPKDNAFGDYIIMNIDAQGFIQDWKNSANLLI